MRSRFGTLLSPLRTGSDRSGVVRLYALPALNVVCRVRLSGGTAPLKLSKTDFSVGGVVVSFLNMHFLRSPSSTSDHGVCLSDVGTWQHVTSRSAVGTDEGAEEGWEHDARVVVYTRCCLNIGEHVWDVRLG